MYRWRRLTESQRQEVLQFRKVMQRPLHSPPHIDSGRRLNLITAACFEHRAHIGQNSARLDQFSSLLIELLHQFCERIDAWVVLPNHYHTVVLTSEIRVVLKELGKLHGRTSYPWNTEENTRGRKVWCNATERVLLNDNHHHATINYVHHNPIKHGLVKKWTEWRWSSAGSYLEMIGKEEAERRWNSYPVGRYGEGWDD